MKPSRIAACLGLLIVFSSIPSFSDEAEKGWVYGPREKIGSRLEHWVDYYGKDYSIAELSSFKNRHTGEPMIAFWITDGSTTAKFMINLLTNQHFLTDVESVSGEFLEDLGIDKVPLDEQGNAVIEDHWDGGVNRLLVRKEGDRHLGAVWKFYWD